MINLDTFTFAPGFRAAAVACGLKTSSVMEASELDLALVATERPCSAAGVFTTDPCPKVASGQITVGGRAITISGCCKGAGMIHPNMATLLAIVTTDGLVAPDLLQVALQAAAARSFNRISVDGDMSTNDTLLLLASGASGVAIDRAHLPAFTAEL